MNLESTVGMESMFDKVWRLINCTDDKPVRNIIGLYGQGGVGKTTLLKKINNQFHKISTGKHDFDYVVIFVLVSKPANYEAMQKKIGERLGLSNSLQGDRDEKSRAQKILYTLRKKNYVLLLDDICEKIDKKRIGIPIHPQGNSKLIFTTRSERVCGLMEATHTFQVECLPWDKAWSLFQDKVGEKALNYLSGGASELAKDVANECGGLPLALITIGRAMSTKKSVQEWRDAIATLRRYASNFKDTRDKVLACLKLSYDNLSNETDKSCFRYCALFPEDYSIQIAKVVDLWIAEGFLNGFDKLDEARNRGHTIIGSLKSACLLESSGEDHVKMHDVIRDLALWIVNNCSSRSTNQSRNNSDNKFLVAVNGPCKKWENAERIFWDAESISNEGENPPTSPNLKTFIAQKSVMSWSQSNHPPTSPNLLTLLVQNMDIIGYCGLPSFFQHMPLLRVLNLSNTFCVDGEFPISICELHELQYLNLSGTFIKELPVELRKLVKLKFLVLNNTYWLRRIPAGLIANLSELQVLDTGCEDDGLGFDDWELEDGPSFSELDGLKQLQEVRINVTTFVAFDKFLCNRKLQMVCTGLNFSCSSSSSSTTRRVLDLSNFKSLKDLVLYGFSELKVEELVLYGSTTDGRLLSNIERLSLDFFLKKLVVRNCEGLETIIEGASGGVLMYGLPKLKSIRISIQKSPKLKKLPLDSRTNITLQQIEEEEDETIKIEKEEEGTNLMLSRRTEEVSIKPECVEIIAAEVNKNLQKDDDQHETSKQIEQVVVRPQSIETIAAEVNENIQKHDDQHETSKQTEQVVVRPQSIEIIAAEVNENLQKDDDQHETSKPTEQVVVRPQRIEIIAAEVNKNLQKNDDQHERSKQTEQVVVRPQSKEIITAEMNKNLQKDDDQNESSKQTEQVVVRPQSIEIITVEVNKNLQKYDDKHETSKQTKQVFVRPQSIEIVTAEMDKNIQEIATRPQTVDIIATEVDKNLQKDHQQISRGRCLGGFFPKNCWSSNYKKKLGKLVAQKKMCKVENLEMKQKSLGMDGYMFEKAWSLLGEDDDDEIRIMGLYGQGGVGKTTLLKQINNEFIKSRYQRGLDIVILVLVSKPIKVEVIQKKIAESLKLSWEGDENRRAEEIFEVLRNKNFVLFLDDIWERIDLQCIGVPRPQGKSKIIFTTRSKIVCRLMEADKTFKVECLPWNKAWSLFQENVGEEALNSDPRVPELAKIIAREYCAGLPLALITIGRAMSSKKSLQEWNDTITTLKEFGSGCSRICDEGFSHLKLSYDNLHSETIKSCFLYCSLYPEHHSIPKSQLIDFWIGEGIFQWVNDIDEVRNRAYEIIENLKGAFLLENGEDEETSVKMHDVIRDLALWIVNEFGRRKDKTLVERATGTPNTSDKWENAERIYLSVDTDTKQEEEEIQNDIQMETPPRSSNLSTLMVHGNSYYADLFLSQNFFQFMPLLRVLDFSELEMEEFPTTITELVELQYLGLAKTNIEALPDELRKLVKLKYLNLSHTYFLKKIPPGVIASLSELRVFNEYHSDFGDWEEDGPSLRELTSLRHLDDLGITIETVLALQRLLRNRKLRMCTRRLTINKCIKLKSLALLSSSPLSTVATLSLGNLKRLKELACQNCSTLAELTMNWAVVEDGQKGLLSNLETLTLWNLPELNVFWEKQYVCSSFQNLKEISIIGCNALKDLTWLVYVRNLETLYLRKCQEVEEILDVDGFGRGGDEMLTRDVVFKELKNMYMGNLVRLERICKHALAFPSLKSMVVEDCPHLKKLPLDCDSNVNNTLQRIEGGATWWNQLCWEDDQVKSKFLPYYEE